MAIPDTAYQTGRRSMNDYQHPAIKNMSSTDTFVVYAQVDASKHSRLNYSINNDLVIPPATPTANNIDLLIEACDKPLDNTPIWRAVAQTDAIAGYDAAQLDVVSVAYRFSVRSSVAGNSTTFDLIVKLLAQ